MPRDLFGDVVHPAVGLGSRKWYTLPLSILVHTLVIAAVVIVPLMAADVLPAPPAMMAFVTPAPPPPPPPPPAPPVASTPRPPLAVNPDAPPVEAPTGVRPETGLEPEATAGEGMEGGLPDGVQGSILHGLPEAPPPPPPAPAAPIRVSQGIRPPAKVRDAAPVYPPLALSARVEGIVILEAVIGTDGRVTEARVLRSIPLLDQAALDAVRRWVYTPTLLNGMPVAILMTVTVTFTLK